MKIRKFVSIATIITSFVTSACLSTHSNNHSTDMGCQDLMKVFGNRNIKYSYTDSQNQTISDTDVYSLTTQNCPTGPDQDIVFATNAAGNIRIPFAGTQTGNTVTYSVVDGIGNCAQNAANAYLAILKEKGNPATYDTELVIRNTYKEKVCPALANALAAEINGVSGGM